MLQSVGLCNCDFNHIHEIELSYILISVLQTIETH